MAHTFTAGGQRFTEGQTFLSTNSAREGLVWVVEHATPDTYGKGRAHNLVVAHQEGRPGLRNVFKPENVRLISHRCGNCGAPLANDGGVSVHPVTNAPHTCPQEA